MIDKSSDYIMNIMTDLGKGSPSEGVAINGRIILLKDDTALYVLSDNNIMTNNPIYYNTTEYLYLYENQISEKVNRIYNNIMSMSSCPIIYYDDNPRNDEKFEAYVNCKATEGANFYYIDAKGCTPFIPIMKSFPSLTKADKINLTVYDTGNNILLVKYTVTKKKLNITYDIYFTILNVNRPLYERS